MIEIRVRSLVGEAACRHALTGAAEEPQRLLAEALSVATDAHEPRLAALTYGQAGLVHLRSGDAAAAVQAFDRALTWAAPDDHRDLAILYINRAAAALELGELDAAVRDHEQALRHAEAAGSDRYAAFARHNLGWVRYRQGDFPAALRIMEEAAATQPGGPDGWSEVSRAHVLLDAGLVTEAEKALADSTDLLSAEDLTGEKADALLARARCAILLQRPEEAVRWARGARRVFARVGNDGWALQSELVALEARLELDRRAGPRRSTLRRRSEETLALTAVDGSVLASREAGAAARLLAAEWALLAGDVERAQSIVAGVRRLTTCPLPLRIHHESVRAQVAFAAGDRRRGLLAVRRGLRVLADHRARLGSVDAVTAAAAHGSRLARVDVEAALATGRASAVFDATERGRAAYAGAARVRPPQDEELAYLLTRARTAAEEARELAGSADPKDRAAADRGTREARRLQDQARRRSWQLSGPGDGLVPEPTTARAVAARLREVSSGTTVVSYLLTDRVRAVRVDATGARMLELGSLSEVTELARRVRQDVEVLANSLIPAPMREVAATSARRSLARLDDLLLRPVGVDGPLQVAARRELLSVPWASLPSRAGVATGVDSWVTLRDHESRCGAGASRAVVVAGPGLRAAELEARLVAATWGEATTLSGAAATCAATTAAIAGADVVHLAAHGVHEPDNPLFSCVRLADGPLYAHELDGVDLSGAVVVLSACETGRTSVRLGGEPLGMTSVLLRLGARAVVSAVAPLRDDVAARVMPHLHAELRAGTDPAAALARAVAAESEPVPLVCFGPLSVDGRTAAV
ncbi:CHAT domain-containing protein [Isoptericola aurantiacus]|uniref:CHAT domain-containing protein n=1 Tax=Isoptericola aurantiacus TaxID=3377839 RepID=UPI00383A821D